MSHLPPSREQPTNIVDLLHSSQPIHPAVLRSHYPSWVDDDIRQTLEQALADPVAVPNHSRAPSGPGPSGGGGSTASESYQQTLNGLVHELRSKQYEFQHRQRARDEAAHIVTPHPPPAPAVNVPTPPPAPALSQSQGTRRHDRSISPRRIVHRSSNSLPKMPTQPAPPSSQRGSGSNLAPSAPAAAASAASMQHSSSMHSLHRPISPRLRHSISHTSLPASNPSSPRSHAHVRPSDTVEVPLAWFRDMEQRLQRAAEAAARAPKPDEAASEHANKAAELQRVKYAMLITKLEEMNRLHREVLNEEHQKQHLHDLEQLQRQHLREFHSRLEAVQSENARLLAERDAERASLIAQRDAERSALHAQRESERKLVDQWSAEKDTSIDSLRTHFLERERLLLQAHRDAESAFHAQKAEWHAASMRDVEERDRERRAADAVRADQATQVAQLLGQTRDLQERLNRRTLEAESATRAAALAQEENTRLQSRADEAAQRMSLVDSLESSVRRLEREKAEMDETMRRRETYWQEQVTELDAREARLHRLRDELDARENARREARRRERREVAATALDAQEGFHVLGSLHRVSPADLDCAWASGPIDRKQLTVPTGRYR